MMWRTLKRRCPFARLLLVIFVLGIVGYYHYASSFPGWEIAVLEDVPPFDPEQKCRFPSLHPFHESILPYLKPPATITCKWRQEQLTYVDGEGVLQFNATAMSVAGYTKQSLSCFWQPLRRQDGKDDQLVEGAEMPFESSTQMVDDVVSVHCKNSWGVPVYSNVHAALLPLSRGNVSTNDTNNKWSVLFFGIDSMSHANVLRYLPLTYRYLTRSMDAVVLHGMNKVGDNSYPNILPILSGAAAYSYDLPHLSPKNYFDDWPLVWKNFSHNGYVTLLAEDEPRFTVFNYMAEGFYYRPTDFYLRPFWVAVEQSTVLRWSSNLCLGAVPKYTIQMNYLKDFIMRYKNTPYFAFSFLTEISHDYLNLVGAADESIVAFLQQLHTEGDLQNTVLFFMSDHGHRFDVIRSTTRGRMEECLPFSAVVLPKGLVARHPKALVNLRSNAGKLASMFDYHATLVDLLQLAEGKIQVLGEKQAFSAYHAATFSRGISLFDRIPISRECSDAGIPDEYCACEEKELSMTNVTDGETMASANRLVNYINNLTEPFRNVCSILTLSRVIEATVFAKGGKKNQRTFRIIVQTSPGEGVFEGRVGRQVHNPNRINRYGNQSSCVTKQMLNLIPNLKLLCYCLTTYRKHVSSHVTAKK